MGWHTTDRVDDFVANAGDFLRRRPVENTVPLTLAATLQARGPYAFGPDRPVYGWWTTTAGEVQGAFLQTPPHPLLLTSAPPDAVPALAGALVDRPLPGVNARSADAETFAATWRQRTGGTARTGRRTRLYRLATLTVPDPPPGRARVAGAADRAVLIDWYRAFHADIGEPARGGPDLVDDKLEYGGLTLWEVDGEPVAMAGVSRTDAGMVRVAAVYTPPDRRGRGYGGAVTAAVSRAALDGGATDVVLFTDLANPTSNALYQRLGYRPVEDRTVMEFTA
ncbi:GNAT family N-acetyltransferase [Jidongwangia harbinensis]|uniref:GNAT family N-acetyltransferase n=1 Tax=Jidongwangia harbinensis TaxID=2878561 RepID=UPI001CD9554F|nr:GNAT family N-acetyltransferase [Jidongwangia harbinensis]MCA2213017.1 GNAT family N-acetyltransferase [Jidongwangia harbinensis]